MHVSHRNRRSLCVSAFVHSVAASDHDTPSLGNVPPLFHCFDKCLLLFVHLVGPDVIPTRLVLGNLAAWSHGACVVYPSEVFDPKAIVDSVVAEKCTALHGVPTHFLGVLSEVDKRQQAGKSLDLSRLRYVVEYTSTPFGENLKFRHVSACRTGIAAGSPIPIELMKSLIARLNLVDLTNAYGMSEYT